MAESHKTLQAIICDILFPCADCATSDAQEKPRIDLLCQNKKQTNKKKTVLAQREQEREQDRGKGTIMLPKTV